MQQLFAWVPFYQELADRLLGWRDRQAELIQLLNRLREEGRAVMPLTDIDASGAHIPLTEIDPFTFFALFNRGLTDTNRNALAVAVGEAMGVRATAPTAFAGIPVVNNQRTWFFGYAKNRGKGDISTLWTVFEKALEPNPLDSIGFAEAFNAALALHGVRFTLTMGLFWVRPTVFASLDKVVRVYTGLRIKSSDLSASRYIDAVRELSQRSTSFPQLSYDAWLASEQPSPDSGEGESASELSLDDSDPQSPPVFWFVGANWDNEDQTSRFLSEGIWENGYTDKLLEQVRSMRPGERIAIKSAYRRKNDLPFDCFGKFAAVMAIKAVGTIIGNSGDGIRVDVQWQETFAPPREWYFYTNRTTIWAVRRDRKPYNDFLIDFAFKGLRQNYSWFLSQPYWAKWLGHDDSTGVVTAESEAEENLVEEWTNLPSQENHYGIEDMLNEGVFLERSELEELVHLLRAQKNLILQGPPGVGKTFLAKKLAYALIGSRDEPRITRVQFHQSMSYEDFVRGLRPVPGERGFAVVDGPFLEVAETARVSPEDRDYVMIIEEINRGNPSAIFGELLTLLEPDKRDPECAIRLTYHRDGELPFYVPPNMYIIGTMNLADRSLATFDYALRRRFAFESLQPNFGAAFIAWSETQGLKGFGNEIARRLAIVNAAIIEDPTLGPDFVIGHSFFCPRPNDIGLSAPQKWFLKVISKQIVPLLEQYWFDNIEKVTEMRLMLNE